MNTYNDSKYKSKIHVQDPFAKFLPSRGGHYDPYAYKNYSTDTGQRLYHQGNMKFPTAPLAGYDGGNTRPRGPDGRPLPFNQYPSRNVPVPIMDYTGNRTASIDPGSKYNGTYKQEGYGDPRFDDFGQEEYYDNRDYYMDDVIDPGLSGYDRGPLYFS